jgi:hypothetical protein
VQVVTFTLTASGAVSLARRRSCPQVTGLLLLGGQTDVVPTSGRYPTKDSQTRTFAPARLHTTAVQTNPADSERVGGAGTNCQEQGCRGGSQENSVHERSLATHDGRLLTWGTEHRRHSAVSNQPAEV